MFALSAIQNAISVYHFQIVRSAILAIINLMDTVTKTVFLPQSLHMLMLVENAWKFVQQALSATTRAMLVLLVPTAQSNNTDR